MKKGAQIGLVFLLFAVLIWWAGGEEIVRAVNRFQPIYLAPLALLSMALIWVSCVKWNLFLRAKGQQVSLLYLMRLYTIGYFFNLFTPSFVGGDIARSYQLGKEIGKQSDAFVATFLERFTGLLAMVLLAALAVVVGAEITRGIELAVAVLFVATGVLALVCFSESVASTFLRIVVWAGPYLPLKLSSRAVDAAEKLYRAFGEARQRKGLMRQSLLWAFAYHGLAVLNTYVAALAIGWDNPSIMGLFVATPLALIVGMVPLTPSGLGIQEGAFVFFLERIGGSPSEGLLVALLLRAKTIVLGVIGGLLFWSDLSKQKSQQLGSQQGSPEVKKNK